MKYQADEKAAEYKSLKNSSMATPGMVSPKIPPLPAHRELGKPEQQKTGFKISKRPQSATVRPHKETGSSGVQINDAPKAKETNRKKVRGDQADEHLLFKTKM